MKSKWHAYNLQSTTTTPRKKSLVHETTTASSLTSFNFSLNVIHLNVLLEIHIRFFVLFHPSKYQFSWPPVCITPHLALQSLQKHVATSNDFTGSEILRDYTASTVPY